MIQSVTSDSSPGGGGGLATVAQPATAITRQPAAHKPPALTGAASVAMGASPLAAASPPGSPPAAAASPPAAACTTAGGQQLSRWAAAQPLISWHSSRTSCSHRNTQHSSQPSQLCLPCRHRRPPSAGPLRAPRPRARPPQPGTTVQHNTGSGSCLNSEQSWVGHIEAQHATLHAQSRQPCLQR